ncbi:MAG: ADP-ribose pyrophosphatase [Pseudonocardiales bacterium]|nr:MAG: ADP-ribose pyrophosphatase [Pseudonocardiales bacterium]
MRRPNGFPSSSSRRASDVPADASYSVASSTEVYRGKLMSFRRDEVVMPGGRLAVREVLVHPGAVVIAAVDELGRIVMVRQFRHPVRRYCTELPAGLLDVDGEPPYRAAVRELAEEAGLRAASWHTLLDLATSPGISDEIVRVLLARELSTVDDADRYLPSDDEEVGMTVEEIDLDDAVRMALAGELENAATVAGVLAAARARDAGWPDLRPADSPWHRAIQ